MSEIELVADHIIIINKGKLISQGNIMQLLNEEDMIIHLEVDDVSRCKAIIQETFGIKVKSDDLFIQFKLNKNNIPSLVNTLVQHQIKIFRLDSKRGLEELYLNITTNI